MRISKTVILMIWCLLNLASVWLVFVFAADQSKELWMNPGNAVHHVVNVVLLSWEHRSTLKKQGQGLLWIQVNNFVISQTWDDVKNKINAEYSSILWWIKNQINSSESNVILWGQSNEILKEGISQWKYSTILWWSGNKIKWSDYSVILWWLDNELKWNYSVVWWQANRVNGDYSTVLWENSRVVWNYSVALWSGSKIKADNSFLWTDGNQDEELKENNVFAVVAEHWLVVKADKPHAFSQLTVWGPLIVYNNGDSDNNLVCNDDTKWVLKVINRDASAKCFCSCDGVHWNSLYWQWKCAGICDKLEPKCGGISKNCSSKPYSYSWSCEFGTVVEWTWAYMVTTDDVIHRSCQTSDWLVQSCTWTVEGYSC